MRSQQKLHGKVAAEMALDKQGRESQRGVGGREGARGGGGQVQGAGNV